MQFYEKLDFLMNITKTSNSALSLQTSLDASHISRLRRGHRGRPKDRTCLKKMAAYFARHCTEGYQRKALFDALHIDPSMSNSRELPELPELIEQWLVRERSRGVNTVEGFLDGFSNFKSRKEKPNEVARKVPIALPSEETTVHYGIEGKRQAVVHFLSAVVARGEPQTLLLFSDEDMEWMTGDREFLGQWASLMFQAISNGNRIKIIHTVSRNLHEMLDAITQWMPLYMSGAIEPYYYPKKRDGVFKRTLFIAPRTAAVVSSSVGDMLDQAANVLFRNSQAVHAFLEEYNAYLSMCRPLMRIFTAKDEQAYVDTLLEFEKEPADTLIRTESLSILTMPEEVVTSIMARYDLERSDSILALNRKRTRNFEQIALPHSFAEVIRLPAVDVVRSGGVKVAFSEMLGGGTAYYTAEEYILHLENMVRLLETRENFHVHVVDDVKEDRYAVYVKEDFGAFVAKTSPPSVVLAMDESNLTAAFWDFLASMIGEKAYANPNNRDVAHRLRSYIQQLRDSGS